MPPAYDDSPEACAFEDDRVERLPVVAREGIQLVEIAGVATLAVVWFGLLWLRRSE